MNEGLTDKAYVGWLADKMASCGCEYAKEAAEMLLRQSCEIERTCILISSLLNSDLVISLTPDSMIEEAINNGPSDVRKQATAILNARRWLRKKNSS